MCPVMKGEKFGLVGAVTLEKEKFDFFIFLYAFDGGAREIGPESS